MPHATFDCAIKATINEAEERKLKRCPFRGCDDVYLKAVRGGSVVGYLVHCSSCGYSGPSFGRADLAVKAWNQRVGDER